MFFFIGGIQPRTVTLDESARLCPNCGLAQARLKRIDQYLSLFFIPLFPVKRGDPVIVCDRCGTISSPGQAFGPLSSGSYRQGCSRCGHSLEPTFRYCPHCGNKAT